MMRAFSSCLKQPCVRLTARRSPQAARCYSPDSSQPHSKLSNGEHIPLLGLGTWKSSPSEVGPAVEAALDIGFRHLDCATAYGNHSEIGKSLAKKGFNKGSKRDQLWVTTKLFNSDHESARVPKACKEALSELGLDYLDLYLVHWPCVKGASGKELQPSILETWMAMENLLDAGLVKTIGISNFSTKKTKQLLGTCRHAPSVNQVESHPYWRNGTLADYCASMNVHLTQYSPLGTPDFVATTDKTPPAVLEDETVKAVAAQAGKTPAQVLLKWGIQRGHSVIPKSVSPERIQEDFDALSFDLTSEQFEKLSSLQHQARYVDGTFTLNPEHGPYRTLDQLWDGELGAEADDHPHAR